MAGITVRFLDGQSDLVTLQRLYDTVLAPSFPPSEREPVDRLARVLAGDELRGAIAVTPDGEPVGALFLEWFAGIRAGLLCYFAVRPDLRGRGIGRRLILDGPARWRPALRPHVIYAEAEDPRFHAGGADYGDGEARLSMYAGLGLSRLPLAHVLPEFTPGAGRLANLLLLVAEADETVRPTPGTIRGAAVADFLTRYFQRYEGPPRAGDAQLDALLAECRRTELLPLSAL